MWRSFLVILACASLLAASASSSDFSIDGSRELPSLSRKRNGRTISAYVTHGVNAYNGKKIFNFTGVSNIFEGVPPMEDIGVLNEDPNAMNATQITEDTPEEALMASMFPYTFHSIMGAGNPMPVGPFNIPIGDTPTVTPKSSSVTDREEPADFSDSGIVENQGNYAAYRRKGAVTLKDYNAAWGTMKVVCRRDGTAAFKIKMRGIPLGLYTAWDIIITDSMTAQEALMVGPFGGAPNVIATDRRGFGTMERKLNYCPLEPCQGSKRCTIGVIMLYHFDNMVYGAAPELAPQGYGPGNAASHHLMFLTNGKPIGKRYYN